MRCATALVLVSLLLLFACGSSQTTAVLAPHHTAAVQLTELLRMSNPQITATAKLLADTGNSRDVHVGALQLITMAETVAGDDWREAQRPVVARISQRKLSAAQGLQRLNDWQRRHWVRIYDAMTALGGPTVIDHCKSVVADEQRRVLQRRLAGAVLKVHSSDWPGRSTLVGSSSVVMRVGNSDAGQVMRAVCQTPAACYHNKKVSAVDWMTCMAY